MKQLNKHMNTTLDEAIAYLEEQKKIDFIALKTQVNNTYESLKPVNIINQTLSDLRSKNEVKENIIASMISVSGGYLSKKLIMGNSKSVFKKIIGYVIQYGITNFISRKVND